MGNYLDKPLVIHTTRKAFIQRANRNGTYRSVCSRCGKIVSVESIRTALANGESKHICSNPKADV